MNERPSAVPVPEWKSGEFFRAQGWKSYSKTFFTTIQKDGGNKLRTSGAKAQTWETYSKRTTRP